MAEEDSEKSESKEVSEEEKTTEENQDAGPRTVSISVNTIIIGAFILGLVVGLSGGILVSSGTGLTGAINTGNQQPTDTGSQNTKVDISELELEGEPVLGQADTNVTIVAYEDFQCPYCKRFETNTLPQIKSTYVESGQVKVIWKDFPIPALGHDWAEPAAAAMECVYREGGSDAFWNVKEKLFNKSKTLTRDEDEFTTDNIQSRITQMAAEKGVTEASINSCLENGNPMDEVTSDRQDGRNLNTVVNGDSFVSGTPSFVIYSEGDSKGEPVVGAQPFKVFQNIIESKLNS